MVDLDTEIYELLNKQIKINELRYLSSGDDSDTFLCNGQYVVKVPKRDSVRIVLSVCFQMRRWFWERIWQKSIKILSAQESGSGRKKSGT